MENAERLAEIDKKLKSLSTKKSRLQPLKKLPSTINKIADILLEAEELRLEKARIKAPRKTFTTLTQADVDLLDYEETLRALESIRSKKSNTRNYEDQTSFLEATEIEQMLLERRTAIQPTERISLKFSEIQELLEQNSKQTDPEWLANKLLELISE